MKKDNFVIATYLNKILVRSGKTAFGLQNPTEQIQQNKW